jgi:hypothetical protein
MAFVTRDPMALVSGLCSRPAGKTRRLAKADIASARMHAKWRIAPSP